MSLKSLVISGFFRLCRAELAGKSTDIHALNGMNDEYFLHFIQTLLVSRQSYSEAKS
jgi:hypothetical protein